MTYYDFDELTIDQIPVEYEYLKDGSIKGYLVPKTKKVQVEVNGITFDVAFALKKDLMEHFWHILSLEGFKAYQIENAEGQFGEKSKQVAEEILKKSDDEIKKHLFENRYDPEEALGCCDEPEGYLDDRTGIWVKSPLDLVDLKEMIAPLPPELCEKRGRMFISILQQIATEDMAKTIVENAKKKKNGQLYKGRILPIARLNVIWDTQIYQLIAKNEKDTALKVEIRHEYVNSNTIQKQDLLLAKARKR